MNSAPSPQPQSASFQIMNAERKSFTLKFSVKSEKLDINITNNSSFFLSYKLSFKVDDFYKLNKFFRQFDSVEEIYDFIVNLENIEEKINMSIEDKFINLIISIPNLSKSKSKIEIKMVVPAIEVKESDLIIKLCEKIEKIDILEKKINYLFTSIGKTEKEFYLYEEMQNKVSQVIKDLDSKIITPEDFFTVSMGIKENLNKTIKEAKLLYRSSRDGDSNHVNVMEKKIL